MAEPAGAGTDAELRTRRLVVVDDEGVERVVASVTAGMAEVRVLLDAVVRGRPSGVSLFAGTDADGVSVVGLALVADGDSVAEVLARREADGWSLSRWVARPA